MNPAKVALGKLLICPALQAPAPSNGGEVVLILQVQECLAQSLVYGKYPGSIRRSDPPASLSVFRCVSVKLVCWAYLSCGPKAKSNEEKYALKD